MKRHLRFLIIPVIIIIIVLLFRTYGGQILGSFQSPFVQAGTWVQNNTGFLFKRGFCSMERLAQLEDQRIALAVDRAELERLVQENQLLRQQLAFVERRHINIKTASITSRNTSKHSKKFNINQGRADGLLIGNPVMVGNGNLVGKVSSVNEFGAVITGLTDFNMATAVTLLNSNRTIGIAQGTIGDLLSLNFIPHDEDISINDLVVTSGLEEHIPSGLIVGVVTSVEDDPGQPFQKAIIEPLIKISDYSLVSVIINQNEL